LDRRQVPFGGIEVGFAKYPIKGGLQMILAITNTKGGVGKTTTAVNLSAILADRDRPTLLVDLDPQAHATRCFLNDVPERDSGDLIMDKPSQAARSVCRTPYPNLDIIPATSRLIQTSELLAGRIRREERLFKALNPLRYDYREIILDCPPTLGILTYNAVIAADLMLIPVQPGAGAVSGLDTLLETAVELRGEDTVPYRLLVTMFDIRTTRTNTILEEFLEKHRRRVLKSIIFKTESLNQANLAGKPITKFWPTSRGAYDYEELCQELLQVRLR
jgi:chromosome partitioning protein